MPWQIRKRVPYADVFVFRYRDQKARLGASGISRRIFLIEWSDKGSLRLAIPLQTLKQAMLNTQVRCPNFLFLLRNVFLNGRDKIYVLYSVVKTQGIPFPKEFTVQA